MDSSTRIILGAFASVLSRRWRSGLTFLQFLGNVFNYGLFGVLSVQVYFYVLHFPKDRVAFKALVFSTFILDIVQTVLATLFGWTVLVTSWGNFQALVSLSWILSTFSPLSAIVALVTQSFFAWRIWILASSAGRIAPVVGIILLTSMASFAMAIVFGITLDSHLSTLLNLQLSSVIGWLSTSVACDLMITVTLVIQLRSKVQQEFALVNNALHRATRMTLETGGLTCVAAAAQLFLSLNATNRRYYFYILLIISGKIYSNSLLASLNSRAPIFRDGDQDKQASNVEVWQALRRANSNLVTST